MIGNNEACVQYRPFPKYLIRSATAGWGPAQTSLPSAKANRHIWRANQLVEDAYDAAASAATSSAAFLGRSHTSPRHPTVMAPTTTRLVVMALLAPCAARSAK